jgi:hypothetical protein
MQKPDQQLNWMGDPVPTEEEQDRWSKITVIVSALITMPVLLLYHL